MKEVEYTGYESLQIGDEIWHKGECQLVIDSLDESFLITHEVDDLLNNFGCKLYRDTLINK